MLATLGLAFIAGILSILSPCVLPLLPVILGAAASEHRWGPVALSAGLTLSFTVIGLFVATVGFSIGLDEGFFRAIAAVVMILVGAVLTMPLLQTRLAVAAGPVSNWTEQKLGGFSTGGAGGQFGLGLLLGAVWVPCVGPTLGAASLLAAQGENLGQVAATMLIFGIGAAVPLASLGLVSREVLSGWRSRMARAGRGIRMFLGITLIVVGAAVLTGLDKTIETALVDASPDWLTNLTTRY
ncbi:MAG: cytochrome c biogenesis protein CcdA [Bauldia sp.]|uniref:cytochrome c biogenesis CcdA family protein n=1 Tax=Bauldia sp. TaxID=2575872 RepID=UPI001DA4F949|nr:cytochrome c biogenesis CcdA family protein [Bauldia sp.]MCB1496896.1 cytochrome c biogenesis protein CcdA [Bauldia sp.]